MSIDFIAPDAFNYLKVVPTYECSRGCHYCYNTLLGQQAPPEPESMLRSLDQILKSVRAPIWIELIGGEPLQRPALGVSRQVLDRVRGDSNCAGVVLSTAISAPAVLRPVIPHLSRIYISLDASAGSGNRKRFRDPSIRRIVDMCASSGVELVMSCVLFGDETSEDIARFIDRLASLGVRACGFAHQSATYLSQAKIATAIDQYYELFKLKLALRDSFAICGTILDSTELHFRNGLRLGACECGLRSVVLEPDGGLSPGVCMDHRRGIMSVDEFSVIRSARPQRLLQGVCGTCPLWEVCHGGCVSEAIRLHGTPYERATAHCQILLGVTRRVRADVAALESAER